MPASTTAMVPQRPMNLPVMNAARLTGLEKSTNTVRFSTSLCTSPAATKTATMSPKPVTATRPKSFIMRPCSPRLMLPSQRPPTIIDQREHDDDGKHAVADRLLEGVDGDGHDLVHAVTTCMKKSSSVAAPASASATLPLPDDATLAHDGDARAELVHVAQDVRVEEHRLAALVQALDDALDLDAADRVEPGHRLVEQHELRVVDERLGDADALQHALGVLAQVRVGGALADPRRASSVSTRSPPRSASRPNRRAQKPRNSRPER